MRSDRATFVCELRRGALLLPTGLAATGAVAAGRRGPAARRLGLGTTVRPRTLTAALATVGLGVLSLLPLGLLLLFVLRGLLYGVIDPGPYGDAWGGPSRAGAWLAHAAIGAALAGAALVALRLLAGLHRRLVARLDGRPAPAWTVPVALLTTAARRGPPPSTSTSTSTRRSTPGPAASCSSTPRRPS